MYCWLNGEIIAIGDAKISVTDRGFLYGETIFESMLSVGGRIPLLANHLERLFETSGKLGFLCPYTPQDLIDGCDDVLGANQMRDGVVRLTLSRGQSERGIDPRHTKHPVCLITNSPLPGDMEEKRRKGYRVEVSAWRKPGPSAFPNFAKTGNYLNSVLAYESIVDKADEALLLDEGNHVTEGSFTNIFAVKDGQLLTPALPRCLPGVARHIVIDIAKDMDIEFKELDMTLAQLTNADEMFLTNAIRGVMPISSFRQKPLDFPGPYTSRISSAWAIKIGLY